jgi:hypothetical protein
MKKRGFNMKTSLGDLKDGLGAREGPGIRLSIPDKGMA